jgi:hypothetical protein
MLYSRSVGPQILGQLRASQTGAAVESVCVCDEKRLLAGARQFDPAALARIHDCFYKLVYRYARYRIGDAQVAEDMASEVFLRLLDALRGGKVPRQSLRGWKLTRNCRPTPRATRNTSFSST